MDFIMDKFTIVLKAVMNVLKILSKFIMMIINIIKILQFKYTLSLSHF